METLKITSSGAVSRVLRVLRKGEVCAVPTDTVYGLIADAKTQIDADGTQTHADPVEKIYRIKGRDCGKPLSVFVSGVEMAKEYGEISERQEKFLERAWPGGVMVILRQRTKNKGQKNDSTLSRFVARDRTIGMRAPKDEFLQKVLKEMGAPLAQTSANISEKPPARNAEEILLYFNAGKYQLDLIVDGGARGGEPSTVIDLSSREPKILREGAVSRETVSRWYTYF